MAITLTTHLNFFQGEARAALGFYQGVFGGELVIATYGQLGMPAEAPDAEKVVFGQLIGPGGLRIMAYDVPGAVVSPPSLPTSPSSPTETRRENGTTITDRPFFLSLRASTLDEAARHWEGLGDGATVIEGLASSAWSAGFGMIRDRFGVTWVIDVSA
ncbi:PhnB protein [Microbacterium resistens]|uniref:PhnB protein n=1 Tax=Microbacterium resistens TaxID=156977 RepID=A0ABU1S878_9MICO|nr:VOC family protein [Microbacterium resistens]MDR6865755.1 PhnB protein [Microbacterium resistens]